MAAEAVLLDLDGTLWDSHPWFAALAARGDARRQRDHHAALRARRPAATLLRASGVTGAAFTRACRDGSPVRLYPEAAATLDGLADAGVPLGAVTNLPRWLARPMLEGLGLDRRLGSLVTYERTTRRKPHPDPLLLALDELAVRPSRSVWFVGDSASDAAAAAAACVSFAWVAWGYERRTPRRTDAVLRRFPELLEL